MPRGRRHDTHRHHPLGRPSAPVTRLAVEELGLPSGLRRVLAGSDASPVLRRGGAEHHDIGHIGSALTKASVDFVDKFLGVLDERVVVGRYADLCQRCEKLLPAAAWSCSRTASERVVRAPQETARFRDHGSWLEVCEHCATFWLPRGVGRPNRDARTNRERTASRSTASSTTEA